MQRNINIINSDLRENPQRTRIGQEVVSIAENFWVRLSREGRFKSSQVNYAGLVAGTLNYNSSLFKPSLGCIAYPKKLHISSDVDAFHYVIITTGINDADIIKYYWFNKAYVPYELEFDGEVYLKDGGNIEIRTSTSTAGHILASINGIEVTEND